MSDTPRTNNAIKKIFERDGILHESNAPAMLTSLSRQLERELAEAKKDSARLDWLADVDNYAGGVILPRSIVEQNLDSMRHAIDAAMEAKG